MNNSPSRSPKALQVFNPDNSMSIAINLNPINTAPEVQEAQEMQEIDIDLVNITTNNAYESGSRIINNCLKLGLLTSTPLMIALNVNSSSAALSNGVASLLGVIAAATVTGLCLGVSRIVAGNNHVTELRSPRREVAQSVELSTNHVQNLINSRELESNNQNQR